MNEQNWKRVEYETWDEAFRGLTPIVRQQSVRVAAYTQALFVQACKQKFGVDVPDGEVRMRGQYADLAYKCGMYHQLGKALVPPEYQIWQKDFTEEERAVYVKYTTDGRVLVATLQEKSARAKEKRKGKLIEQPTQNIPWLMLRESCEQHMERWNGSGYPSGRMESEISPIAQIVGIAKELDRLASETKSESPFELAYEAIIAGKGELWSPELIEVFIAAKEACLAVYNRYIAYTLTLPKTIPLIDKRPDRAMGLKYRPMIAGSSGKVIMYEASPWFGGIANRPGETEGVDDVKDLLVRTNLVESVSWYFLYEVTDTLLRIKNCRLELDGIVLNMIPEFYKLGTQLQKFIKLFEDQPVSTDSLILTVPEETVRNCSKTNLEIIRRYLRNKVKLMLDSYHPDEQLPADKLLELGFTHVRLSPELYNKDETKTLISELNLKGFTVLGSGADNPDILEWLEACEMKCFAGTMTGIEVNEEELILDSLAREQN